MNTTEFLESILSSQGRYCIFSSNPETAQVSQSFVDTIEEAYALGVDLDAYGNNVYFALATYNKENNKRTTQNIHSHKALFLDLDCGTNKDFADQVSALGALRDFCSELSLPKPVLVNSGNGVHVYWVLEEEVSYDEWLPVATKLKRACTDHGLYADPAVTADGARVLRLPDTHNYKAEARKPVGFFGNVNHIERTPISIFSKLLGADVPVLPSNASVQSDFDQLLAGNTKSSFNKIIKKTKLGKGCAQLANILVNQAEIEEPLWRAGLSIAKFCEDSEYIAIKMSSQHPDFSEKETLDKLHNIQGPYLCERFADCRPDICKSCPNNGKIKSPIVLGREIDKATEEEEVVLKLNEEDEIVYKIPLYPKPYFRGKQGGVYIRMQGDDGDYEDKLIYHNDIYVVKRMRDIESGENIVMRLHLPQDGVSEFTIPLTAVTSREEFRKHMAMQGVAVLKMDMLMAYTLHWVQELQASTTADSARRQFGWVDNAKGFVLGDKLYRAGSVETNHASTATAQFFSSFQPEGTLAGWKDTINFYNQDGMELHQYVLCTGFGSPLMHFMPLISAAGLHIYSKDSGLGKTTSLAAACTIWGFPDDLLLDDQDTKNFKMNRGELYKNLPLYLDEVTNTRPEELSALAYQLTSGRQRGRLASNANQERARGESWSLLSVSTGNTSFIERISAMKIMPKAEQQRILEMRLRKADFKPASKDFTAGLAENYGHAGVVFVKAILQDVDSVKELLNKVKTKVDRDFRLTPENRFWSAHITCTLTGAIIAKRLGLIQFDLDKLTDFCGELINRNRAESEDEVSSIDDILNDYMNENVSNILEINSGADARLGEEANIIPQRMPRGELVARLEPDTSTLFLIPKPLKKWCISKQINYASFVEDLTRVYNAKRYKMRIGKGTNLSLPPTHIIAIKLGRGDVQSLQDSGSSADEGLED